MKRGEPARDAIAAPRQGPDERAAGAGDDPAALARALDEPALPPPPAIGERQRRRFDIHRNNAVHAMVEAMRASFPVVEKLVGEAFFAALARAYLASDPPRSPVLFHHGAGFGDFIEGFPPARSVPYLGDVARLEWLRLRAYHAADAEPAGLATLAVIPAAALPGTRLDLHPALGLLRSRWPVVSLWAASAGLGDPADVDLKRPEDAAVLRPALDVDTRALPPGGGAFLTALAEGASLGAAAEAAAAEAPETGLDRHLQGLFGMGAVAGVHPAAAPQDQEPTP